MASLSPMQHAHGPSAAIAFALSTCAASAEVTTSSDAFAKLLVLMKCLSHLRRASSSELMDCLAS